MKTKLLLFLFLIIYSSIYSAEYKDTTNNFEIESEYYNIEYQSNKYFNFFHIEIETINTPSDTVYSILTLAFVCDFNDIKLKSKNDEFLFLNILDYGMVNKFRAAIKQDNGSFNLEFHIFIYNFNWLRGLYKFLKTNAITDITFSGEGYKETFDIKYYKDFQKNLINMLEKLNKVDQFLN